MKDFFKFFGMLFAFLAAFWIIGTFFGFLNLSMLGFKTNLETHITRQTNAYLTAHQTALREMKAQYDDLERQLSGLTDASTVDALHSQERGIARQMHEEADLIPNDVQPDIAAFLTSH